MGIGCASEGGWVSDDYKIETDADQWSFVVAMGGNGCTNIFVGDFGEDAVPKQVASVKSDIARKVTWRIGNESQGPGKVANILVFDGHLKEHELESVYYQSKNELNCGAMDGRGNGYNQANVIETNASACA